MIKLRWNKDLEISAQRWADQCVRSSLYDGTDSCRDLEYIPVGQNIATIFGEEPGLTATSMIDLWFVELLNINASILSSYLPSSLTGMQHYDYFTQLVWGSTTQVGCGGVKFKEIGIESDSYQNRTVNRLVCNFAPAGNHHDKPVYSYGSSSSRCDFGSNCDSEYTYLCSSRITSTGFGIINYDDNTKNAQHVVNDVNFDTISNAPNWSNDANFGINSDIKHTEATTQKVDTIDTQFDFFSDLFEMTKTSILQTEQGTTKCKEVLAVDEFIELLKSRISNDHILKDLFQLTTRLPNTEPLFADGTVAAIVKQLYSKKETPTTSKSTDSDSLNSTLLVDLVEAIIFRHSDNKYTSTEDTKLLTPIVTDVKPVKIQAELGEIKTNKEFTGHYFFPEEEKEETEQETSDLYDEIIPSSEISLEIEELKRHHGTKDFLEEILESDFISEGTMRNNILPTINKPNGSNLKTILYTHSRWLNLENSKFKKYKRAKRKTCDDIFINYIDLLKKLAADLRNLKLYERFHCSYNSTEKVSPYIIILGVLAFIVCIFQVIYIN